MMIREWEPKGIEGRIAHLQRLVGLSIRDPLVSRQLALAITQACPWRDDRCELSAIWHWMHQNIRYTADIAGYDSFATARRTIQFRGGDCDDGFTLISALAMGNGFQTKGRITKNYPGGPYAHIYPLVGFPKNNPRGWVPLDWTLGFHRFGAHPPQGGHVEFDGAQITYNREIPPDAWQPW